MSRHKLVSLGYIQAFLCTLIAISSFAIFFTGNADYITKSHQLLYAYNLLLYFAFISLCTSIFYLAKAIGLFISKDKGSWQFLFLFILISSTSLAALIAIELFAD
jgi:hypothetical protein